MTIFGELKQRLMLNVPLKTCDVLLMNEFVFYLIFYPSSPTLLKHINRCYKRGIELGKKWKTE